MNKFDQFMTRLRGILLMLLLVIFVLSVALNWLVDSLASYLQH